MKHSLRTRFTLLFVGIMALVLFVMYEVNSQFLETYYMNQKVQTLEHAYHTVDLMVNRVQKSGKTLPQVIASEFGQSESDSVMVSVFRELNDKSNINVVLLDAYENAVVAASREGNWLTRKLKFYLKNRDTLLNEEAPRYDINGEPVPEDGDRSLPGGAPQTIFQNDDYCIQLSFDSRSETAYLESWGYFTDGATKFIMSMPVAIIHDSVAITNRFLLMVGIAVLVFGSILVYLAANAITRPINRLALISERMTKLDFAAKYEGSEKDEIGILGHSMNTMSEQLERTIAELKTANHELQKDIDEKTRVDEMRKDFIANVSHELKTPIALIQGYAEGLSEGMAADEESREYYCGVIADEAGKMNKLVKQLTSLNNLEIGKEKVEFSLFDIEELCRDILEAQNLVIRRKEAEVVIESEGNTLVWADEFKIEEVITNFFTNALNHLAGERKIRIRICGLPAEKKLRLSVINDGAPIPEEDLPHIWEKFYKVDKARTREYGGSGIGLSIVKAIVESHGQSYGACNTENGVEFWFTLESAERTE